MESRRQQVNTQLSSLSILLVLERANSHKNYINVPVLVSILVKIVGYVLSEYKQLKKTMDVYSFSVLDLCIMSKSDISLIFLLLSVILMFFKQRKEKSLTAID